MQYITRVSLCIVSHESLYHKDPCDTVARVIHCIGSRDNAAMAVIREKVLRGKVIPGKVLQGKVIRVNVFRVKVLRGERIRGKSYWGVCGIRGTVTPSRAKMGKSFQWKSYRGRAFLGEKFLVVKFLAKKLLVVRQNRKFER